MSLYRQTGGIAPRTLAIVAIAVLVAGALAGFLIGRGTASEPTAAEVVADAREELAPVSDWLGVIPSEYEGSVAPDGKVLRPTEYGAAEDAATNASTALAEAEDMAAVDPKGFATAEAALERLEAAIGEAAPEARVAGLTEAAQTRVDALAAS